MFEHREGDIIKNVLLSGVMGSGSTVAWQIINDLNSQKILKSHGFEDCCPTLARFDHVIVTVRHPFDRYFSWRRRQGALHKESTQKDIEYDRGQWEDVYRFLMLNRLQIAVGYRPDMKITFLKYEDFWNKDRERIIFLSNLLEKRVSDFDVDRILSETSIEKNFELSETDENVVLGEVSIKKDHVGEKRGIPNQGSKLCKSDKQKILSSNEWAFDVFGYDKNL